MKIILTSWICFGSSNTTLRPVTTSIITYREYRESQLHMLNTDIDLVAAINLDNRYHSFWLMTIFYYLTDYIKLMYKTMSNRKSIDLKVKALKKNSSNLEHSWQYVFLLCWLVLGTHNSKAIDVRFNGKFALSDVLFRHIPQMFPAAAGHADGRALMFHVRSEVCHAKIS